MSKCVASLSWILFVVLLAFDKDAEAVLTKADRNPVTNTYNGNRDPCFRVNSGTDPSVKQGADKACRDAFQALDRVKGNSCKECQQPECRSFNDYPNFQCSCWISELDTLDNRRTSTFTFNDCASNSRGEENQARLAPAPTTASHLRAERNTRKNELTKKGKSHKTAKSTRIRSGEGSLRVTSPKGPKSTQSTRPSGNKAPSTAAREGTSSLKGGAPRLPSPPGQHLHDNFGNNHATLVDLQDYLRTQGDGVYCKYCLGQVENEAALHAHYGSCPASYLKALEDSIPASSPSPWTSW